MKPKISILVPSFEYPEGVIRILELIRLSRSTEIECLIGDDSRSNKVESKVKCHPLYLEGKVIFHRNKNSKGAVNNWNRLLKEASGEFLLFMHHDECPEKIDFFDELKLILEKFSNPDVTFLRCSHFIFENTRLRYHMSYTLTLILLKIFSYDFLLLHNLIGAPSNVLVRKDICLPFNEKLKWLVDVDWMVRLLDQTQVRWILARNVSIISERHSFSITKSLSSEIPKLKKLEAKIIQSNLGKRRIFNFLLPDTLFKKILAIFEILLWYFLYIMSTILCYFSLRNVPSWWIKTARLESK